MKNFSKIFLILFVAGCHFGLNAAFAKEAAQTKIPAQPMPTPKTKKSLPTANPTAKAAAKQKIPPAEKTAKNFDTTKSVNGKTQTPIGKTSIVKGKINSSDKTVTKVKNANPKLSAAPKPIVKPETKPAAAAQIITTVAAARVRSEPNVSSDVLKTLNLGTILNVSEKSGSWLKVQFAGEQTGWISKTITTDFSDAKRGEIYQQIVAKRFKNEGMDFRAASETFDFLKTAQANSKNLPADLAFKRLLALRAALKAIPFDKAEQNPYKSFLKTNEKEIVYSEPSAQWFARSELFWELHGKSAGQPISEEIAWQAAQNPLPGECEGYVNCYLFLLRNTNGEYLNFYPDGKYSRKALQNVADLLAPIAADAKEKTVYNAPADISDRAEFNRLLTELRAIISKSPQVEKARPLQQIKQIGEGYR